jgi:polo-like kinase 4
MVKAKTPKITYYSPQAKCQLMETLEDFELSFYQDGTKIVRSSPSDIKGVDKYGQSIERRMLEGSEVWDHYQQCLGHCLQLEKTLSGIESTDTCFPLIVGRKPSVVGQVLASSVKPLGDIFGSRDNFGLMTPKTPSNVSEIFFFKSL